MPRFEVHYHGSREVTAESAMEAEIFAAFDCSVDNCEAELIDDDPDETLNASADRL